MQDVYRNLGGPADLDDLLHRVQVGDAPGGVALNPPERACSLAADVARVNPAEGRYLFGKRDDLIGGDKVAIPVVKRGADTERPSLHRLPHDRTHLYQIFGGRRCIVAVDNLVSNAVDAHQHGSVGADPVAGPFCGLISDAAVVTPRAAILTDHYGSDSLHQVVDRCAGTGILVVEAAIGVRMHVDDAWHDIQAVYVDLPLSRDFTEASHGGNTAVADCDIC